MSSKKSTDPIRQESFAYPTERAFRQVEKALMRMAITGTELDYPQDAEQSDEIDELVDSIIADIKELEGMMLEERGFDEEYWAALRAGAYDELFIRDEAADENEETTDA